jgi:hypothetical protein
MITDPADADLPVYSLSNLPLIVFARNPIVSVELKSVIKFTLIVATSIVLPTKIGLDGSYAESGKLLLEKPGKDVSVELNVRGCELAPEEMMKTD